MRTIKIEHNITEGKINLCTMELDRQVGDYTLQGVRHLTCQATEVLIDELNKAPEWKNKCLDILDLHSSVIGKIKYTSQLIDGIVEKQAG